MIFPGTEVRLSDLSGRMWYKACGEASLSKITQVLIRLAIIIPFPVWSQTLKVEWSGKKLPTVQTTNVYCTFMFADHKIEKQGNVSNRQAKGRMRKFSSFQHLI